MRQAIPDSISHRDQVLPIVQKGEASHAMFTNSVEDEYDFIVVGSGAGGGPIAVNLAKAGYATRGFAELVAFNADSISTF